MTNPVSTTISALTAVTNSADDLQIPCDDGFGGQTKRVPISEFPMLGFPPLAAAPADPSPGWAYFDTVLGYPRVYGSDAQWHGLLLS